MSLFSDLGEKVERFKQSAVSASEDQAEFVCRACEEPVFTDQERCPHCGAEAVERVPEREDAPPEEGSRASGSEGESGGTDRTDRPDRE
ncbi:zinc ribbon domain-containing protein [Saliphagus sp. LR7]|uniref:zinc ribbon domain-containing protein n=1 Tax=Saliphagus sp. LR7 TaxID=2282654 RepID=UPI000DF80298|nr:zinc ribbon domain-containing protein [Saliphagus sp. LR7]